MSESGTGGRNSSPSLRASMRDGMFNAITLGFGETYLGVFGIFLQATTVQIGLLATLPQVFEAIAQWISALALDRFRSRRTVMIFWASVQTGLWLPIALLPFFLEPGSIAAISLICLVALNHVATGFIHPVWSSLMGDLVPIRIRGRYFGSRNRLTGMSSFFSLLVAGGSLHFFQNTGFAATGFLLVFLVAMIARALSLLWIRGYADPPYHVQPEAVFSFPLFSDWEPQGSFLEDFMRCARLNRSAAGTLFSESAT